MNGLEGSTDTTPTVRSQGADVGDERADERRLADTGRPGHAHRRCVARRGIDAPDDALADRARGPRRARSRVRARGGLRRGRRRRARPPSTRGVPPRGLYGAGRPSASRASATSAAVPFCSCRRVSSTSVISARRRSKPAGSPFVRSRGSATSDVRAREHDREHGSDEVDAPGDRPGRPCPRGVDEQAGAGHRETEDGVVARHQHGERAAAHRVRRATLHEHLVADDRSAVAHRRDAREHRGNGDRRRRGGDAEADAHHEQCAAVHPRHAEPSERGRCEEAAEDQADPGRRDEEAEAEVAGADLVLGERDLGDVDECRRDSGRGPYDEHRDEVARMEDDREPVAEIGPVAPRDRGVRAKRPGRDPADDHGREDERRGVRPVRDLGAGCGEEPAGEDRAERPRDVLDGREERGCLLALVLGDEVRHPRPDGRAEEARRDAVDAGQRDDRGRVVDERQRREGSRPHQIRDDHQPATREAVDERPERHADDDDRQEVRDQEGREPATGVGPIEDVDRERECGEVRPDGRAGRRPEQQGESPVAAE